MSGNPFIVVFPRGQLSADDKMALQEGGVIGIEADDPPKVHQVHLSAPMVTTSLRADDLLRAALSALSSEPDEGSRGDITTAAKARSNFVRLLATVAEKAQADTGATP